MQIYEWFHLTKKILCVSYLLTEKKAYCSKYLIICVRLEVLYHEDINKH